MQLKNQIQYASLVLLMASGRILAKNNLDNIDSHCKGEERTMRRIPRT